MRRQAAVGKAGAVALALVAGVLATTVEAGVRLGHPRQDQCAAPGCNYVDGKGACVFAADGPDGLLMVLNGASVRLHRRERLTVLRRGQAPTATPGNRFMSVYDSTGSSGGGRAGEDSRHGRATGRRLPGGPAGMPDHALHVPHPHRDAS